MFDVLKPRGKLYYWKRSVKFFFQRITRGFSDRDTWNMDTRFSEYILPRLRRFKELNCGYPPDLTPEQWDKHLDAMIYAFEWYAQDCSERIETDEVLEDVQKGIDLFAKFYGSLWW